MATPSLALDAYVALALSASAADVDAALGVAEAPPSPALAQLILDDLKATLLDDTVSRLSKQGATQAALPKLKDLGKSPEVAAVLSSPVNLRYLLGIATVPQVENSKENSALRCIANTCLLIESARTTFISPDVNGANVCLDLLQRSSSLESIYLTSRILFLCTASLHSAASLIESMVEKKLHDVPGSGTAVNVIATKMDELVHCMVTRKSTSGTSPEDAMTDLLKLVFNLCAHYPKLVEAEIQTAGVTTAESDRKFVGEAWSPRLDGLIPPLLRAFHGIPPTSPHPLIPPMVHIIHSLITIPVNASNRSLWFGPYPSAPLSRTTPSGSTTSSSSNSPNPDTQSSLPAKESRPRAFERALSALAAGRRSFSRSRPSLSTSSPPVPDTAIRACELLDTTLVAYYQGDSDPDHLNVRNRFQHLSPTTGDSMSDILSPLAILITRFCIGDEDAKLRIKSWFVPENLDRTKPLQERDDALGRCLRLLPSVFHQKLAGVIGEMFFAMYDSNPLNLTALGYGHFAGFLFNKGLATGPPTGNAVERLVTPNGLPIDPITGTIVKAPVPDGMTEEEKEREAERLFMLFDRLERTGALSPDQNPIRKAIQKSNS